MRDKVNDIAAAILAGGENLRMSGFNKAFIKINGTTIVQNTMALLKGIFEEVILVTNSPEDFKLYESQSIIIRDAIKGIGPLGGIHSALSRTSKKGVFFVACDMPFLHNAFIRRELNVFKQIDCDSVVPRIGSFIEPLHAVYKKNIEGNIRYFIKNNNNFSIKSFLETVDVYYWDLKNSHSNRNIFRNLNTKEDLRNAKGVICG